MIPSEVLRRKRKLEAFKGFIKELLGYEVITVAFIPSHPSV